MTNLAFSARMTGIFRRKSSSSVEPIAGDDIVCDKAATHTEQAAVQSIFERTAVKTGDSVELVISASRLEHLEEGCKQQQQRQHQQQQQQGKQHKQRQNQQHQKKSKLNSQSIKNGTKKYFYIP